jgi:hypothetical protein
MTIRKRITSKQIDILRSQHAICGGSKWTTETGVYRSLKARSNRKQIQGIYHLTGGPYGGEDIVFGVFGVNDTLPIRVGKWRGYYARQLSRTLEWVAL